MTGRLVSIAALALLAAACQPPPEFVRVVDAGVGVDAGPCQACAVADLCCGARTANPDSNCELLATCQKVTGQDREGVLSGCRDYLRVGSTPPAPAVCGPHPDAE